MKSDFSSIQVQLWTDRNCNAIRPSIFNAQSCEQAHFNSVCSLGAETYTETKMCMVGKIRRGHAQKK
jgi:hypothetical protein